MLNPNTLFRAHIPKLLLVGALGGLCSTACDSREAPPIPKFSSTAAPAPSTAQEVDGPICESLTAEPNLANVRQVTFVPKTKGIDDSLYSTSVRTDYGDGTADLYGSHEYAEANREYRVRATVILNTDEAAGAPLKDGTELPCPQILIKPIEALPPPTTPTN